MWGENLLHNVLQKKCMNGFSLPDSYICLNRAYIDKIMKNVTLKWRIGQINMNEK